MRRNIPALALLAASTGLAVFVPSCLDRPLTNVEPEPLTSFTTTVSSKAIDQVDILFVIDNSASMGDKQAYLAEAVPLLITRLVQPNCVDAHGNVLGQSDPQGNGKCTSGTVEFPPVHDMHIGLLSSSLGTRLSDQYDGTDAGVVCATNATLSLPDGGVFSNHNDDRAELLNRTNPTDSITDTTGSALADAGTLHYLNWFPTTNPKNVGKQPSPGAPAISDPATLIGDFKLLITGLGNYGCGIESQLESWYRFLVQPDPYDSMSVDANGAAQWVGVDSTILAQRQAFLRPDSLVAIIDMTDENDSEIDVRSFNGDGYYWMSESFDPWNGTPGCAEDDAGDGLSGSCESCGFSGVTCASPDRYSAGNDWGFNPNLRHVHMMQKYGAWPQFPIRRYQVGLTSTRVPDRSGEYPAGASSYQGLANLNCTNPLFAASLPDGSNTDAATLCNLPSGPRTPDLVYYAHIGGVPHQLLPGTPGDGTCPAGTPAGKCLPKETLSPADWTKILGRNPLEWDYTGIDPHMIESYEPRTGIPVAPSSTDPEGVSDWTTNQPYPEPDDGSGHVLDVDREYACTFPLVDPQTGDAAPRDCTNPDPTVQFACDCPSAQGGLTEPEIPPVCNPQNPTQQIAAKTYPTERELLLANLMGPQGFVSSLCPIDVTPSTGVELTDPLFGYNPAVNGIVDRLKNALDNTCLPQTLTPDESDNVPCLILVQLATNQGPPGTCQNPGAACDPTKGLLAPGVTPPGANSPTLTQDILDKFCENLDAQYSGDAGPDPSTYPVCAVEQLNQTQSPGDFSGGTCASSSDPGWCYVTGTAANGCAQALIFSATGQPPDGARVSLQCIENSFAVVDAGGE
jgi:hypothetical protein